MKGTRRENVHTLKAAVNDRKPQTKFSPITAAALREKMSAGGMHHCAALAGWRKNESPSHLPIAVDQSASDTNSTSSCFLPLISRKSWLNKPLPVEDSLKLSPLAGRLFSAGPLTSTFPAAAVSSDAQELSRTFRRRTLQSRSSTSVL